LNPKNGKEIDIVTSNFRLFTPVIDLTQGLFINFHINKCKAYEEKSFDHR